MKKKQLLIPIFILLFCYSKGQENRIELKPECMEYLVRKIYQNEDFTNIECAKILNKSNDFFIKPNEYEYISFSIVDSGKLDKDLLYIRMGDTISRTTFNKGIFIKSVTYSNNEIDRLEYLKDSLYYIEYPSYEKDWIEEGKIFFRSKAIHLVANSDKELLKINYIDSLDVSRCVIDYVQHSSLLYNSEGILTRKYENTIYEPRFSGFLSGEPTLITLSPSLFELKEYPNQRKSGSESRTIGYDDSGRIVYSEVKNENRILSETHYFYTGKVRKEEIINSSSETKTRTYDSKGKLIDETVVVRDELGIVLEPDVIETEVPEKIEIFEIEIEPEPISEQNKHSKELRKIVPFKYENKWGIVDNSNVEIVEPKYNSVRIFDDFKYAEFDEKYLFNLITGEELSAFGEYCSSLKIEGEEYHLFTNSKKSALINIEKKDTIELSLKYNQMNLTTLYDLNGNKASTLVVSYLDNDMVLLLKDEKKLNPLIDKKIDIYDVDFIENNQYNDIGFVVKKDNYLVFYDHNLEVIEKIIDDKKERYDLLTQEIIDKLPDIYKLENLDISSYFNSVSVWDNVWSFGSELSNNTSKSTNAFEYYIATDAGRYDYILKKRDDSDFKLDVKLEYFDYDNKYKSIKISETNSLFFYDNKYMKSGNILFPRKYLTTNN